MAYKSLVASIIKCLAQLLEQDDLNADSRESLEVSIQCLGSAYGVQATDALPHFDILSDFKKIVPESLLTDEKEVTPEAKAEAEKLKNEGNALTKQEKYLEALANYTKAIKLDGKNAVYYCNRAAVHSKLANHYGAIEDCRAALAIDPTYSKAYGRLGLAYSSLEKYKEAKEYYQKALELEPDNESIRNNLKIAEEKYNQQQAGSIGTNSAAQNAFNMDFSQLLSNPALMNMATQMLSDPIMHNMLTNLVSRSSEQGRTMEALIEAGQTLAQQFESSNPELIESIRRQRGRNPNEPDASGEKEI